MSISVRTVTVFCILSQYNSMLDLKIKAIRMGFCGLSTLIWMELLESLGPRVTWHKIFHFQKLKSNQTNILNSKYHNSLQSVTPWSLEHMYLTKSSLEMLCMIHLICSILHLRNDTDWPLTFCGILKAYVIIVLELQLFDISHSGAFQQTVR